MTEKKPDYFKPNLGFTEEDELQKLCDEHWSYIEQVIRIEYCGIDKYDAEEIDSYCRRIRFHYISAMKHGFKHGVQSKGK